MQIITMRGGKFVGSIEAKGLASGLRATKQSPRNTNFLVDCHGAVGQEGVLTVIGELDSLIPWEDLEGTVDPDDPSMDVYEFPNPHIFVGNKSIIMCLSFEAAPLGGFIFEYEIANPLDIVTATPINGTPIGIPIEYYSTYWTFLEYNDFIYLSNGETSYVKDPITGAWGVGTLPIAKDVCDFNGQMIAGGIYE